MTPSPAPQVRAPEVEPEPASPVSAAASRIYLLGEERYAEARYPEAVALWGHAMLQLPADSSADGVRHKLLARMGHGLLQAFKASDDPAYLRDGKAMCELYLAEHEELFGQTDRALAERGEIYELLYEFEWRLEHEADAPSDDDATADESSAAVVAEALTPSPSVAGPPGAASESDDPEPATAPEGELPEEGEGELYRFIRVRRVEWARLDDPRVIAFLRDTRDTGPSLLDAGNDLVQAPRVLVRAGGLPQALQADAGAPTRRAARRVGLEVIESARAELRRCYEVAMTRDPVIVTRVEVQLTVEPDGHVTQPMLVGGSLIDAEGDACMAQALRETRLANAGLSEPLAIAMPVQFFLQEAKYDQELFWRERPEGGRAYDSTAGPEPMPTIDAWAY
ncbi:hypothetical protein [Paraliomyxa miuraensis]|uniref:hypothetical protein n=1 Tax=Paraliomyxa miuraensis TaxID=376150 RepID=UPI00224CAE0A|nr:hypothetical protein [Paraliomyxa miuraensis]MCX4247609.1 hypothetical protein [Paraliomyxa miuraensis]